MSRQVGLGMFNPNDKAKEWVADILDSGRISYGKYSKGLEARFSSLHDCKYGVLSNSGTSSLQVALQAMKELYGWNDGDIVFVPASTFVATVNIVLHCNLKPVLIDVNLDDYSIEPNELFGAATAFCAAAQHDPREPVPRCIIPVHPFGQPANMDGIMHVASEFGLRVIEDSCEAMFVKSDDKKVGSIGDVGCFSFYVAHLVTAGVGGISITNNSLLAAKMRSLVNHGRDGVYISIDDDEKFSSEIIDKRFKFTSVGHSFRITEIESALALSQLDDELVADMLFKRRKNAQVLTEGIGKADDVARLVTVPSIREGAEHSFMMYPILLDETLDKSSVVYALEEAGIETRDMLPITNQPVYHELLKIKEDDYPMAKLINTHGFYVGCHQGLTGEDMAYVAECLIETIEKQGVVNVI